MRNFNYKLTAHENRSIVRLRTTMQNAEPITKLLHLPHEPLRWRNSEPGALWLGPDQWLLVSDLQSADQLIDWVEAAVSEHLHTAIEMSAAFACLELSGPDARMILAAGCGLDIGPKTFVAGSCAQTRFADLPLLIAVMETDRFDLYVDTSYEDYLRKWITNTVGEPTVKTAQDDARSCMSVHHQQRLPLQ